MYPSRDTGQENLGLSPFDRRTLQQMNKQLPVRRHSNDPHVAVEEFLLTIPLDAGTQEFLSDTGHRTLVSADIIEVDKWMREKGGSRVRGLYSAAMSVLWAEIGVRLALGESIVLDDSPVDPDWLALIDVVPCPTAELLEAKDAYVKAAAEARDAEKKQS